MAKKYTTKKLAKTQKLIPRLLQFFIWSGLLATLPIQNSYAFRAVNETYDQQSFLIPPTPAPYPVKTNQSVLPELTAEGIVVVDIPSGVTIYEKNPAERLLPASTTKVMTALVSLERYNLSDVVTIKTVIKEGQNMGLHSGETMTVENLLYGMLVYSANDAAYALAEHYPTGVAGFVERMNTKAQELNLVNSHFVNPIGFDDANHFMSAHDLARLSLLALKHPIISKIAGTAQITVSDTTYTYFHPLKNINELVGKIPGVSGLKTGHTELAGQALVTTAQKNGQQILIVLLKSSDRFKETQTILEWIFNNFTWQEFKSPS